MLGRILAASTGWCSSGRIVRCPHEIVPHNTLASRWRVSYASKLGHCLRWSGSLHRSPHHQEPRQLLASSWSASCASLCWLFSCRSLQHLQNVLLFALFRGSVAVAASRFLPNTPFVAKQQKHVFQSRLLVAVFVALTARCTSPSVDR